MFDPLTYLSVMEAARFLGLSASTLNKMRVRGDGPPFSKCGRRVLYLMRDLSNWMAERRRQSTAEGRL